MKKLYDLRFVIGLFFLVIGIILIIYGAQASGKKNESINWGCGLLFAAFGGFMVILSSKKT